MHDVMFVIRRDAYADIRSDTNAGNGRGGDLG